MAANGNGHGDRIRHSPPEAGDKMRCGGSFIMHFRGYLSFIFLCLFSVFQNQAFGAARLEAQNDVYDFGRIQEGLNIPVTFVIFNKGDQKARIKEIRTFAACVQSRPLSDKELGPGESLRMEYIFESLGYGGVSIKKNIEVHYDSKKWSPLKLTVKGEVRPLAPHQVPLGELTYNFFALIDLRSPEDFRKGHILGAVNIPAAKISEWTSRVSPSISGNLLIYLLCENGSISGRVAAELHLKGYSYYVSVVGGMSEWKKRHGNRFLISGTF